MNKSIVVENVQRLIFGINKCFLRISTDSIDRNKMGSLYRSEEMRFCQMIVEKDAAFACVAELGKKPWVQFKDVSIPYKLGIHNYDLRSNI